MTRPNLRPSGRASALGNATAYVEAVGLLAPAWMGLQQTLAAHGKPGDLSEGQHMAAPHVVRHELPKTAMAPRVASLPRRRLLPVSGGHPVLVLPGLFADDGCTRTPRRMRRDLGHRVRGWRLGRNLGPTAATVTGLR